MLLITVIVTIYYGPEFIYFGMKTPYFCSNFQSFLSCKFQLDMKDDSFNDYFCRLPINELLAQVFFYMWWVLAVFDFLSIINVMFVICFYYLKSFRRFCLIYFTKITEKSTLDYVFDTHPSKLLILCLMKRNIPKDIFGSFLTELISYNSLV